MNVHRPQQVLAATMTAVLVGIASGYLYLRPPFQAAGDFEIREFDHGNVFVPPSSEALEPIAHVFSIRNPSESDPLRLTRLQSSCGCIDAEDAELIPPLGEGCVKVAFHPRLQIERRVEHVVFKTNQSDKKIAFRVSATVLPIIHIPAHPTFRIGMQDRAIGEIDVVLHEPAGESNQFVLRAVQGDVEIRRTGARRSQIDRHVARHQVTYSVELIGRSLAMLRDSGRFVVDLQPRFRDEVAFLRCEYLVAVPVRADPPSLFVRRQSQEQVISILLAGDVEFSVTSTEVSSDAIEARLVAGELSRTQRVDVAIRPDKTPRVSAGAATISESAVTVWCASGDGDSLGTLVIPVFIGDSSETASRPEQ